MLTFFFLNLFFNFSLNPLEKVIKTRLLISISPFSSCTFLRFIFLCAVSHNQQMILHFILMILTFRVICIYFWFNLDPWMEIVLMIVFLDDAIEVGSQARLLASSGSSSGFRGQWPCGLILWVGSTNLVRYSSDQYVFTFRCHIKVLYSIEYQIGMYYQAGISALKVFSILILCSYLLCCTF